MYYVPKRKHMLFSTRKTNIYSSYFSLYTYILLNKRMHIAHMLARTNSFLEIPISTVMMGRKASTNHNTTIHGDCYKSIILIKWKPIQIINYIFYANLFSDVVVSIVSILLYAKHFASLLFFFHLHTLHFSCVSSNAIGFNMISFKS